MFGLGPQELLIILVLVLIFFGAGKLPQVGGSLGKGIRNFKKGISGSDEAQAGSALSAVGTGAAAEKPEGT
jgi:sec-independent protein translocase protein TatA